MHRRVLTARPQQEDGEVQLSSLLAGAPDAEVTGDPQTGVRGLAYDSRRVEPGFLFAAIRGEERDGNEFVDQAVERGAVAVLSARRAGPAARRGVVWVRMEDERAGLATMARNYYGRPDERLRMVGVTGTNGKSTVAILLESIFGEAGLNPCLLGTLVYRYGRDEVRADRTTPESLDLHRHLDRFATAGARTAVLEVSSHALALRRVGGISFQAGLFTNLTQDHLDFHGTMEAYLEAKSILFRGLAPGSIAVLNADDGASRTLREVTRARVVTFGEAAGADVRLGEVRLSRDGIEAALQIGAGVAGGGANRLEVRSPLLGRPNARNAAAAAAAALVLGVPAPKVAAGIAAVRGVPGRMERVDAGGPFMVLVDYAHTDDALANAVRAVRDLGPRRIITVFGCGGDRDRAKRPKMGSAAAAQSDVVVVTSDNPRRENPMRIIEEILPGVRLAQTGDAGGRLEPGRCVVEADRREAIGRALALAREGDCVLIAGKGHENYQDLGDRSIPFDDRLVVRELLRSPDGETRGRAAG
jgi:UDP-N-acetylmuramoyl-L-alanyl-D-glutamate--2,6-diaminopimelate ligase